MNKIGIHRTWGIVIALAILISAFVLFNLMTYLNMNKQINELEQIAMTYNVNYQAYLQNASTLRDYNGKIDQKSYELNELENLMKGITLNYNKSGNKIVFSGVVNLEKFSVILNFLSDAKTLKINKLNTQSQSELPLLIGESRTPDMHIKEMEIELIQIDDKILEG